jgi:hypothetical protein
VGWAKDLKPLRVRLLRCKLSQPLLKNEAWPTG